VNTSVDSKFDRFGKYTFYSKEIDKALPATETPGPAAYKTEMINILSNQPMAARSAIGR
jgi:hypothetical protein